MADSFVLESEKYQVVHELGRGGMGVVYLAEDLLLRRTVALKVLYEHLNRDSSFVDRFRKEARSVSSLRHPNIVFVHGAEVIKQTLIIDMEYVDGISLDKFVKATTVATPVVARIAGDILSGLAACHNAGVVHRDIKPANILLDQDGMAKIADFGLATAYASHLMDSVKCKSTSGFFMGTPRYAPSAAWDGLDPKPSWDLYSLGVMLFEMLSGKVAYPGDTPMAIMRQHLTSPLPPLGTVAPDLSPEFAGLVDSLLASPNDDTAITAVDALQILNKTPEYLAVQDGESAKTIKVALRKQRSWLGNWRPGKRLRGALYAIGFLILGGLAALMLPSPFQSGKMASAPESVVAMTLDRPLTFLRPESIGTARVEDSIWMFTTGTDGNSARIVALNDSGLDYMTLSQEGSMNRFTVAGGWAEYISRGKGSFRYGTVTGEALLDQDSNSLSLSLEKTNSRDQTAVSQFLVAKPVGSTYSERDFVRRLESSPPVQSMIYNELMPRKLAWAGEIETLMPGYEAGRLTVPRADTAITVDGLLNEPVWTQAFQTGTQESLQAEPTGTPLSARWSDSALILGFSSQLPSSGALLTLVVAPGTESPAGAARHFKITIEQSRIVASQSLVGTQEIPWQCDWEVATSTWGSRWQGEVRIPLQAFNELARPNPLRRWRLNATLRDAGTDQVISTWGTGDQEPIEHGMVLVFTEETK